MAVIWTDARKARLKELWDAGKSATEIAVEFGDVSRNAVIGRIHRCKMSDATRDRPRRVFSRPNRAPAQPRPRASQKARKPESQTPACVEPPPLPVDDTQIPLGQRKSIHQLTDSCCHFPVGDPRTPDFFFCGAAVRDEAPYCPAHMRRAHVPTEPLKFNSVKTYARR